MKIARTWAARHDALLFQATFPKTADELAQARANLQDMARTLAALPADDPLQAALENSGIAGSAIASTFSLAATRWLCQRFPDDVDLLYLDANKHEARALLERALDPMERDALIDRPLPWPRWMRQHLGADAHQHLPRLVALVERLTPVDREREAAWSQLQVFVRWRMRSDAPGLTQGRFGRNRPHVHTDGYLRPEGPHALWNEAPPKRVTLSTADQAQLADLGRGVMLSLLRETDFFTHVDPAQIECFDLGRGTQVALYSCHSGRQLALESYVGYLLFKNKVPVAYGGSWVLGAQAAFGVNVLPPYRGGESTLLVCQLLRLYAWRFKLQVLRVEASQIGRDNKDGIQSGSFWFYWRLGFRPLQADLLALAEADWARILADSQGRPGPRHYRADVLKRLAPSILVWRTPTPGDWRFVDPMWLGQRVSAHVLARHEGDRSAALQAALRRLGATGGRGRADAATASALAPMAVLLDALAPEGGWTDQQAADLRALARQKAGDEPAFARAVQGHRGLMAALQALSAEHAA